MPNHDREQTESEHQHKGEHDQPERKMIARMRIKDREILRPEHLPEVNDNTDKGILHSPRHRQSLQ